MCAFPDIIREELSARQRVDPCRTIHIIMFANQGREGMSHMAQKHARFQGKYRVEGLVWRRCFQREEQSKDAISDRVLALLFFPHGFVGVGMVQHQASQLKSGGACIHVLVGTYVRLRANYRALAVYSIPYAGLQ